MYRKTPTAITITTTARTASAVVFIPFSRKASSPYIRIRAGRWFDFREWRYLRGVHAREAIDAVLTALTFLFASTAATVRVERSAATGLPGTPFLESKQSH